MIWAETSPPPLVDLVRKCRLHVERANLHRFDRATLGLGGLILGLGGLILGFRGLTWFLES